MANLPLQDGYETQLSQSWNGATGLIYVLETPVYTPKTTPTVITVNPGKTNAQLAIINDYDASAKTLTVSAITGLEKALGVSSTAQTHGTGSKVIISDNYEFWKDLVAKSDNNTFTGDQTFNGTVNVPNKLKIPFFANAAARDAAITVPTDSMMCYVNDVEEFMGYKNGAWQTLGGGGGGSAVWYQDSTGDGTITGAINGVNTTYTLSHTPGSVDAFVLTYNGQVLERGATDDYTLVANTITMNTAPVSGKLVAIYPDQGVGTQNATTRSTTGASSVNGELFRKSDDSNSLYYKDNGGDEVKLLDITTNKIPLASIETIPAPSSASETVEGIVERATDAEALAGTDTTRYVTPAQTKVQPVKGTFSKGADEASTTTTYTHSLGRIPKMINFYGVGRIFSSGDPMISTGVVIGASNSGIHSSGYGIFSSGTGACLCYGSSTGLNTGVVGNITTTSFDIVWTKTGATNSDSYNFIYTVQ